MVYDTNHGVVKCVRWRGLEEAFASSGNDGDICLFDTRRDGTDPVLRITAAHSAAVNALTWHPMDHHIIMSNSFSPDILLHDIRKPDQVLQTLSGHSHVVRAKGIHHPIFLDGGKSVLCSGDGAKHLSLYDTDTGDVISRGWVGYEASRLHALAQSRSITRLVAAAHGRSIALFTPVDNSTSDEQPICHSVQQ
mmetsp:Transcript_19108/g.41542  ORF Transcript_19108/g.41542 Transcript_19108/m.41542 type:complete len:193 (-) Transcript_19108:32-610(-)